MKAKYEYLLHVWGGFWNPWNIAIHNEPHIEYQWFDTKEARQAEIDRLDKLKEQLETWDACIARTLSEGYLTRYRQVIYSLVKVGDEIIEVENDLGYGFYSDEEIKEIDCFDYFKEYKWDMCADLPEDAQPLVTTVILRP